MGFSTTSYGNEDIEFNQTYDTLQKYSDIYLEEITSSIPWNSLINNTPYPSFLTQEYQKRVSKKGSRNIILALNLLNKDRTNLQTDYLGNFPSVNSIKDPIIENAYYKYVKNMCYTFKPEFLILSMESNELLINNKTLWKDYKSLIGAVRVRIKNEFPDIEIAQSISLHSWEHIHTNDKQDFNAEIKGIINSGDFAAITYFPYFNDLHKRKEFQASFDFLNKHVSIPISIIKTGHIAENLEGSSIPSSKGSIDEQNDFLNTLLVNAHKGEYKHVIWGLLQDTDKYWNTLDDWAKPNAKKHKDTGMKNGEGEDRKTFTTWKNTFAN